jgi:Asp-tRNA(Asn)/Glu-tRNA(Gln) amidotransferase A subunit family amidase
VNISQIHAAMLSGSTSGESIVNAYLKNIKLNNQNGAHLNAIVTMNNAALDLARQLDAQLASSKALVGPLHGIPIVVKDCLETVDMPTSFGSNLFSQYMAQKDATVISKLREAGAIILAKTTLPDWATSWFGYSSRSGETRNPYALDRDPGGSSSGTGAAIAAGFATVGIGTDCGGSVRLPSSFCNLVGVRSTPGMMSRQGCNPLVALQDTIGPMARSVSDAVKVFEVICGFDENDPLTATYNISKATSNYSQQFVPDALKNLRIGVVRNAFGNDQDENYRPVNQIINAAIEQLAAGGAFVADIAIPNLSDYLDATSLYLLKSKYDLNLFLNARSEAPMKTIENIVSAGHYHPKLDLLEGIANGPADPLSNLDYYKAYAERDNFMLLITSIMDKGEYDALVYPTAQVPPPLRSETDSGRWTTLNFPTNTLISSQTSMPAMTVPAGCTENGLPIGMEILTRPYDEAMMFKVGFGFEQIKNHRRQPACSGD